MYIKILPRLDSNPGPLILEATALETDPQPLSITQIVCPTNFVEIKFLFVKYKRVLTSSGLVQKVPLCKNY